MPDTDQYEYVATATIMHGGVAAYRPGDLVPAANAAEHGYLDAGLVVSRADYVPAEGENPAADTGMATVRGQMPPYLQTTPAEPEPEPDGGNAPESENAPAEPEPDDGEAPRSRAKTTRRGAAGKTAAPDGR